MLSVALCGGEGSGCDGECGCGGDIYLFILHRGRSPKLLWAETTGCVVCCVALCCVV